MTEKSPKPTVGRVYPLQFSDPVHVQRTLEHQRAVRRLIDAAHNYRRYHTQDALETLLRAVDSLE